MTLFKVVEPERCLQGNLAIKSIIYLVVQLQWVVFPSQLRGKQEYAISVFFEPQHRDLIDLFFILFKRQLNVKGLSLVKYWKTRCQTTSTHLIIYPIL